MSKDRKINWLTHGISALVGGTLILVAAKFQMDEVFTDFFDNTPKNTRDVTPKPQAMSVSSPESSSNLPLNEIPLDPEILDSIRHSLVTVIRSTIPGYEHHVPSGYNCSGFIIRNLVNKPTVITAGHC